MLILLFPVLKAPEHWAVVKFSNEIPTSKAGAFGVQRVTVVMRTVLNVAQL
jgi:hypothetical protein